MAEQVTGSELETHRRSWDLFLKSAKWFALHVLAVVFFLILYLVAHWPFVPTLILVTVLAFIIGSTVR